MLLSIGGFSRLSGLSIKALRLYDRKRLLRPAEIDRRTGYRRYRLAQITDAHRILALRQMGMSLGEVGHGPGDRASLLGLRHALEAQIEALSVQLATVNEALSDDLRPAPPVVVIKQVPATRVVTRRRTMADQAQADILLDEMCRTQLSALRGTVWHDCGEVTGLVDAQVFLLGPTPRSATDVAELPAALTASCLHGPGEAVARDAYRGLRGWLDRSGYRRAGPYREIYYYLDGHPALTEIQLPIVRARGEYR